MTRYIYDINAATPDGTDDLANGDDEIRLFKSDVKNSFPKIAGEVSASSADINKLVGLTGNLITDAGGTFSGTVSFRGPVAFNTDLSISGGVAINGTTNFLADVSISATLNASRIVADTAYFAGQVSLSATLVCTSAPRGPIPTDSGHLATKGYVDGAVVAGGDPGAVDVTAFKQSRLKLYFYGSL